MEFLDERKLYKQMKSSNNFVYANRYIEKFGQKNPKKAAEAKVIMLTSWSSRHEFLKAQQIAQTEPELAQVLEKSVKEKINGKKLLEPTLYTEIIPFLCQQNLNDEIETTQTKFYESLKQYQVNRNDLIKHVQILESNKISVDPQKIYDFFASKNSNSLFLLKDFQNEFPKIIDYDKLCVERINVILCPENHNNGNKTINKTSLDNEINYFLDMKELKKETVKYLINTAINNNAQLSQSKIISQDLCDDPKLLEEAVLKNRLYFGAAKVANMKGVDAKKIAEMVMESNNFWYNYNFATKVKTADKQAHLDVMLKNIPEPEQIYVNYSAACRAAQKASSHKDIGWPYSFGEVTESDIEYQKNRMIEDQHNSNLEEQKKQQRAIEALKDQIKQANQKSRSKSKSKNNSFNL